VRKVLTDPEVMAHILRALRQRTGIDFGQYGQAGIQRRLLRAMKLCRSESLRPYGRCIEEDPAEADRLSARLLVPVTSFFHNRRRSRSGRASCFSGPAEAPKGAGNRFVVEDPRWEIFRRAAEEGASHE
jgi:CheR methyltransferase-like protein